MLLVLVPRALPKKPLEKPPKKLPEKFHEYLGVVKGTTDWSEFKKAVFAMHQEVYSTLQNSVYNVDEGNPTQAQVDDNVINGLRKLLTTGPKTTVEPEDWVELAVILHHLTHAVARLDCLEGNAWKDCFQRYMQLPPELDLGAPIDERLKTWLLCRRRKSDDINTLLASIKIWSHANVQGRKNAAVHELDAWVGSEVVWFLSPELACLERPERFFRFSISFADNIYEPQLHIDVNLHCLSLQADLARGDEIKCVLRHFGLTQSELDTSTTVYAQTFILMAVCDAVEIGSWPPRRRISWSIVNAILREAIASIKSRQRNSVYTPTSVEAHLIITFHLESSEEEMRRYRDCRQEHQSTQMWDNKLLERLQYHFERLLPRMPYEQMRPFHVDMF